MRFGVLGAQHPHALMIATHLADCGAQPVAYAGAPSALQARLCASLQLPVWDTDQLLNETDVDWLVLGGIPADRASDALAALAAGKHVLAAKPALLGLADVRRVRAAAAAAERRFMVCFSERVLSRGTLLAQRLVAEGAIGRVVHVTGFGPHRLNAASRPDWFFDQRRAGGILADLTSHQIDQFLVFAGITAPQYASVSVASARVMSVGDVPVGFGSLGELHVSAADSSAWIRVDWLSPEGLPSWGDVRLFLLGTNGSIEVRKNIDVGGRAGGDHVFIQNRAGVQHIDAGNEPLTFGRDLAANPDTGVAASLTTEHCLFASELAIRAQLTADGVGR